MAVFKGIVGIDTMVQGICKKQYYLVISFIISKYKYKLEEV